MFGIEVHYDSYTNSWEDRMSGICEDLAQMPKIQVSQERHQNWQCGGSARQEQSSDLEV
jgi:hypothetical protein